MISHGFLSIYLVLLAEWQTHYIFVEVWENLLQIKFWPKAKMSGENLSIFVNLDSKAVSLLSGVSKHLNKQLINLPFAEELLISICSRLQIELLFAFQVSAQNLHDTSIIFPPVYPVTNEQTLHLSSRYKVHFFGISNLLLWCNKKRLRTFVCEVFETFRRYHTTEIYF